MNAPVAFFVFNRPAEAARVFESIAAARPPRLLVVADGPRADHPEDAELCARTRAILERVDWRCEVQTDFAQANLGCKHRIASGLDWVFSQVDEAIVLEDDCLPVPEFFRFSEEMLDRYREDERVHMVRGTNLLFGGRFSTYSYYFSRFYSVWGWATWGRAWANYDVEMSEWPALRETAWLENLLEAPELAELVRYYFDESHSGRLDQWDFQWAFAGWRRGSLAIVPEVNLVTNIGHGSQATHTHDREDHRAGLRAEPLRFPLRHPPEVARLEEADEHEWRAVFPFERRRRRRRWWPRRYAS